MQSIEKNISGMFCHRFTIVVSSIYDQICSEDEKLVGCHWQDTAGDQADILTFIIVVFSRM